ncbi:MAG: MFS transporter [Nitriliruptoraceae bacterium]
MEPSSQPARGSLQLLIDPVFGPFIAAKLLSTAGIWIYNIVAAILVFELSGSALMVGLVSVAQFGPQLVLAPLSGAMADRGDRRRQLVAGKLLITVASGSLAVSIWWVGIDGLPGVWPVMATAFVVGLGFVLVGPAQNALIPALVRPGELAPAIALNTVPPTLARAGGPAIGALVATTTGPAAAFMIAAVTNLLFALIMLTLDIRTRAHDGGGPDRRIRIGVQYLRHDRRIFPLLIGITAIGIGADPAITLMPSLSAGFGAGARLVGVFASAFGVGAGAALLILAPLRRRFGLARLGTAGLLAISVGMAATGISPTPKFAAVSLAVAGAGMTAALTSLTTQLQEWVPDEIRGRIMALWMIAFLGSRPVAAAVNGAVADATAPAVAFLLVAAVVAAAAWRCRPTKLMAAGGRTTA